jgi:hypothetical protein
VRYLEKTDTNDLKRNHFSFSTKVSIGEFLKPTGQSENGEEKYIRLNEEEMAKDVEKIRKENGWKKRRRISHKVLEQVQQDNKAKQNHQTTPIDLAVPTKKKHHTNLSNNSNSSNEYSRPTNNIMTEEHKLMQKLAVEAAMIKREQQAMLQKEALRVLREADRLEKLEQARRDRETKQQQVVEAKQKRQEEVQKYRQEEQIRKVQEREVKRQQAAIAKEQERERRRQHMILMKQLEGKKRNDERDKKREELRVEKERERDKRIELKKLEIEILSEARKPIEDMSLENNDQSNHGETTLKELPKFERIKNMSLSGEAFAHCLMIYEFLNNFGETLGFDMDSLPTLDALQSALLYDSESEEEILSVVIHLVVCAIEDPGIPNPQKHLTLLGQTLRQADITNTNVSEILRIYFFARSQAEVRMLHGLGPPDMYSKDKNRDAHELEPEQIKRIEK